MALALAAGEMTEAAFSSFHPSTLLTVGGWMDEARWILVLMLVVSEV
jgi:hypothetical protein